MTLDPAVADLLEAISRAVHGIADWRMVAIGSAVDRVLDGTDDEGAAADWLRGFLATGPSPSETRPAYLPDQHAGRLMIRPEERYVVVDLGVLEAIRELANIQQFAWRALPGIRLTLRVARIDPVSGNLVIGVRVARDLTPPEQPEHGFGSI